MKVILLLPIVQNKLTLQTSAEARLAPVCTAQVYSVSSVQLHDWVKQNACTTFFDRNDIATTTRKSWNIFLGKADSDQLYSGFYSSSIQPHDGAKQNVCTTIFDRNCITPIPKLKEPLLLSPAR
jgi:hypothetical protein